MNNNNNNNNNNIEQQQQQLTTKATTTKKTKRQKFNPLPRLPISSSAPLSFPRLFKTTQSVKARAEAVESCSTNWTVSEHDSMIFADTR